MKLKQNGAFIAGFLGVFTLLTVTGCSTSKPYQETRSGNYFYLNPFSYKPATPEEHWNYAGSLKERGRTASARKQYEIFVKRWPENVHAAAAKQTAAELYFEKGKNKKAFTAYEELIQQYYTGIKDYDAILDKQFIIAEKEMNRKRMRWLFGGYRAPERAVPYFESIIKNAPQWKRAPEMQYMIGQAYQKNNDQELAVVAYAATEYRYPDSPFAEKAATSKIDSFKELVDSTPYSVDIREQAQLSAGLFPELYTNSQHIAEVQAFGTELHGLDAKHNYEVGRFYERVPRPPKTDSASIYYNKVLKKFGDTGCAAKSDERLRVILSRGAVPADGTKSPVLAAVDTEGESGGGGPVAAAAAANAAPNSEAAARIVVTGGGAAPSTAAGGEVAAATVVSGEKAAATGGVVRVESKPIPERIASDAEAVEVTADRMEYSGDLLIAEGNVTVQQQGTSLQADRVTVNSETGEISATGNIRMIREKSSWEGQNLVYNYKTHEGDFGKSVMHFEPAYITAGSFERISTNEFLMRDVMMTTCEGDKPAIYARAKEARVFNSGAPDDPFIKAKHVTFYIGPVPVFYTPVWQRHLGYSMFTWYFGVGDRVGGFAKLRAELRPTKWLTANSHFDLYSRRGLGLGQDFDWTTVNGRGKIELYSINDSDPVDKNDPLPEQAITGTSRYRVKLEHQERFNDQTYFMTRINQLSDPGIIEDFFETEFEHGANPENFVVVQRATENYGAGIRVDHRLNDFFTTVERQPAVSYDQYRAKLGDSPFYFESENRAAFLGLRNAQMPGLTNIPDDYSSGRLDTYDRIFLPLKYQEFLNVIPRAGYRGTWYSETPDGSAGFRNIYELGTLTSFKTYKHLTDKSGFYGDGLRHVAEPYADYSYRATPNLRPADLYQFDDIDALDKQNEIRFGERNFLQTKRGLKRIANFLDADVYTTYRIARSTNTIFGPLVADAQMSLTDNFYIQSDIAYDWYTKEVTPLNARLWYVSDDQSEYGLEYRYVKGDRSLVATTIRLFPNAAWSYEFLARYDTLTADWEEQKILVNHKFNCIGLGVGYKIDYDNRSMFWIQFWLTAFPQSALKL